MLKVKDQKARMRLLKARADMVLHHPFFASLAMRLTLREDRTCRTAWSDGKTFGYNPDYINILPREKLLGLSAHTVMHPACGHHLRRENRDPHTWNKACDYAINPILLDAGLVLPDGYLWDEAHAGKTAEQVYRTLKEGQAEDGKKDQDNPDARPLDEKDNQDKNKEEEDKTQASIDSGEGMETDRDDQDIPSDPGGSGEVRDGISPKKKRFSAQEENGTDWDQALIQAATNARAMGQLPKGVDILVKECFSPTLSWDALLARFIQQSARQDYTWTRPNRRYIHQNLYLPSLVSDQLPEMVLAVDTSGSIKPLELARFTAELSAILSMNPSLVHLIYADMAVNKYELVSASDLSQGFTPKGGGGTDFRAVFDFVETNGIYPFCLIYFTDLECRAFPEQAPAYPVLWVRVGQGGVLPPFGEIIDMLPDPSGR